MSMTSNRPYLVRAFYDWIVDNNCSPYVVVNALDPAAQVPQDYVSDGQIVLNMSPASVSNMQMDLDRLSFSARFGGVPMTVDVPMTAVMGIYAKENGQGMIFQQEPETEPEPPKPERVGPKVVSSGGKNGSGDSAKKPSLKVVK